MNELRGCAVAAAAIVLFVTAMAVSEASAATTTYVPVADTEVRADIPTVNFGTAAVMGLDGDPVRAALMRFNVSVPPGEVVSTATLRLFMTSTSSANIFVRQVASTTWGETTTTFANAPAIGSQVAASGPLTANAYVSINVTPLIVGSGLVSMAVTRTDTVPLGFNSREAAVDRQAQLVVTTVPATDATPPTVAMTAPASGATVGGSAVIVSADASDNVGVAGVQFKLDGANLGLEDTSAPYSVTWDTATVANGAHVLTAVARDAANNTATASNVPVEVSNTSLTFEPVADTEVRADIPTANFGTATVMGLDGDPVRIALMRFNVSVPPGRVVSTATLRLFMTAASSANIFVRQVASTTWGETTTTFANAPAIGSQVAASGPLTANAYVSINVTPLIAGSGLVSMAVTRTDTVPLGFSSREAAADRRAQLVVTTVPVADTVAPLVAMTAPASDATVAGGVTVSADASDNVGVAGVQFKLDGANLGSEDTSAPYEVTWDTTTVANGAHALTAVARDAANNNTTATAVNVTVSNVTVAMTAPAEGSTVSGSGVTLAASASANVVGVQFKVDGANFGSEDTSAPYEVAWDTTIVANGAHALTAVAHDGANHSATAAPVNVTVSNIIVAMTAPAEGATLSGSGVTLSASASANVVGVQFKLDGADLGSEDMSAPYEFTWDTTLVANGPHILTAVARDAANHSATATPVNVTVSNMTVVVTAPAEGATVSGSTVTVSASASPDVVGVQFKVDDVDVGSEDTSAPYEATWDTTTAANGPHILTAVARDVEDNSATSAAVNVTVSNMTVAMTEPADGATVSGSGVALAASVSPDVVGVQFKVDDVDLGLEDTSAPYEVIWDTTPLANGPHILTAVARDAEDNTATSAAVNVTVSNVTVAMTEPAEGATVSGSGVALSASASGDVVGVQFKVDGADVGSEDTSAPYEAIWDTTTAANGSHVLTAAARDAEDNIVTSTAVNVTVSNAMTVAMTAPAEGATLSGSGVTLSVSASANVVGVQFKVDGADIGSEDTSAPYEATWDTTTVVNGPHILTAVARDAADTTTTSTAVNVTVSNLLAVTITAPSSGSGVFGTAAAISATASEDVVGVQFKLDGANLGAEDTSAPYGVTWDTTTVANGPHTLTAVARNASNATSTSSPVTVTVENPTAATFAPVADTEVRADIPTGNFGTASVMGLDGDPARIAFLRFNVSVPSGQVAMKATLRIFMTSASPADVFVRQVASTTWGETTTTYANAPAIGSQVAASGSFPANAYLAMDVTPLIGAGGLVSMAVTRTDTVPLGFNSREAAVDRRPQLIVEMVPAVDTGGPLVAMTAPAPDAIVAGAVTVSADASDNVGVAGVQFKLDGANLGAEDTSAPYEVIWDTTIVANGAHALTAVARDAANNSTTATPVNVTVSNVTVTMTAPAEGATVSGSGVTLSASASTNVVGVQFKVDGADLGLEDTSAPFEAAWDTTTVANGPHILTAVARDSVNHSATAIPVNVTVSNLSVAVTAPSEGATVSGGLVAVSADALGDVAGVQFKLDGANLDAEDTSAPYSISWDTTAVANGPHTLTAVARDPSSNTATATTVNVTVSNLSVAMTAPSEGSGVSGPAVPVSATASANVVGIQFKLDGNNLGAEDTSAPYSIIWDTTAASHGVHKLSAVARAAAGNTMTSSPIKVWVTNPTTLTLSPVSDTEIRSDSPNSNFGTSTLIALDGSPTRSGLLRFNVGVPPGEVVSSATLRLFMTSSSSAGVFVRQLASTSWGETTTTFNNAPAIGAQVAASGAISGNAYLSINVTPLISGTGLVSMAVTRTNTSAVAFNSREAATNNPQLVVVTVPIVDTTAPSAAITAPAPGAGVAGSAVTVSANASDNVGVAGVQFKLDGNDLGAEDTSAPYTASWDTTAVTNGPHTLTAVARDTSENSTISASVDVTVSNMSVEITAPAAVSLVSGSGVAVSAAASPNVVGVQFQLDGNDIAGEDTSAPYSVSWDTTTFSNGFHTLRAVARNAFGNLATSSPVMVKVANPMTSAFGPVVDTEVNSSQPDTNFGTLNAMGVDGENPTRVGYLMFNVSLPDGETVSTATLRLFSLSTSSADTFVNQVASTEWSETATTYSNAPPVGAQVGASGPYTADAYVSIDITSAISGSGLYSFALTRTSSQGNGFSTREGVNPPQLVIETIPDNSGPPDPPDPVPDAPPTVSADGLPTWQINGVVWSQAVVGNTVYVTGSFTKARPPGVAAGGPGEVDALNIFAYDISTGARVAAFNHSLNAQGLVIAPSPDGSRIYVGGDFTAVDGFARGHVAAFRTATGALDLNFTPNVQGQVQGLAVTNTRVYVGGAFGNVNGQTRTSLAALDAINGTETAWAPAISNNGSASKIYSMVMAPDRSRVIVGGTFSNINGQPAIGMGSIDANTGATLPWAANLTIRNNGIISSLRTDGEQIYGSGYVYIAGGGTGNFEGTFAANPNTGNITVVNDCHGDTYDVFPIGPVLYSAGHAHDCTWIGSFPDTNPRVRWQRALAQTIAPHTVNTGPDSRGWNYAGLPASTLLHWFPQFAAGTYTGVFQGPYSVTGNDDYIVLGGEFPTVNGVAQQGLVRMAVRSIAPNLRGPSYTTVPSRPAPPTTASSTSNGSVNVGFGTAWDYDNQVLNYDVFRNGGTLVHTTQIASNFWTFPTANFTDTGLTPGSTAQYQVRITDPYGNAQWSLKSSTVTVCCAGGMQAAAETGRIIQLESTGAPTEPRIERVKRVYLDARAEPEYRPVLRKGKPAGRGISASTTSLRASAVVRYSDRVMVSVKKLTKGKEEGRERGSFPGRPNTALTFTITNHSGRPIDLNQVVVTTQYGSPGRVASTVYNSPLAKDFSGVLRPGASATATYVFAIPLPARMVVATVDFDSNHAPARFVSSP